MDIDPRPASPRIFAAIYTVALTARIVAGVWLGLGHSMTDDEPEYFHPAVSISRGLGYQMISQQSPDGVPEPTAYRMPGPAMVMAMAFAMFGPSLIVARLTSAVFSSFSAPLLYLFARRFAGERTGILTGLACCLYPSWVFFGTKVYSEPYFVPSMIVALILSTRASIDRRLWSSIAAGLAWGLTAYFRPHALPIAAVVALFLLVRAGWPRASVFVLAFAAMMLPWVARNQIVFGRLVLLATEGGETFLGSNNPYVLVGEKNRGMWISPMQIEEYRDRLQPIRGEVARSEAQYSIAFQFLRSSPAQIPRLVTEKLRRWLTPLTGSSGSTRWLVASSYGSLLALLCLGAVRGTAIFMAKSQSTGEARMSPELILIVSATLVFTIVTAVYWGGLTRGRVPVEVLWIPWGAASLPWKTRDVS